MVLMTEYRGSTVDVTSDLRNVEDNSLCEGKKLTSLGFLTLRYHTKLKTLSEAMD